MESKYKYFPNQNNVSLKICCITYNLHGIGLEKDQIDKLLLTHKNNSYDIYAISTQESQRSILMNLFFWDKSEFELDLARFFGKDYVRLNTETLGGLHLIIFIKKIHKNYILNYYKEYIKTGFYGLVGNKGGIAIGFKLYNLSFLFINCHLSYGFYNSLYRNYDFDYIKKNIHPNLDIFDVVIWMGDFNYRVNKTMEEAQDLYKNKREMSLLEFDQMNNEIKNYNLKISEFKEGKINFLPTYKYKEDGPKNEIICDNQDHIPSWTDRIFYKIKDSKVKTEEKNEKDKYIKNKHIAEENKEENDECDYYEEMQEEEYFSNNEILFKLIKYDSMQNIVFSDHKPVYAYFDISVK